MRGWSDGKEEQGPAGGPRAGGAAGVRAAGLSRIGVVGDLSAVIAALVSCCGSTPATSSPGDSTPFEERRQGHLVRDGKGDEGREGHVDGAVLDDAQVLRVQPGDLRGLLLRESALVTDLSKPQAKTALRAFDRSSERGSKADLGGTVIAG